MAISSDTAALQAEIRRLAVLMQQQLANQSALAQSTLHVADSFNELDDRAHDEAKALKDSMRLKRRLNEEERELLHSYEQAMRRVIAEENKILKYRKSIEDAERLRLAGTISQTEFDQRKLEAERKIAIHEAKKIDLNNKATAAANKFKSAIGSVTGKLELLVGILASVGGSFLNFNRKFMEATTASAGVIEETTGNFDQGLAGWMFSLNAATGVEGARALEFLAANRQMVNALGGIRNTFHELGNEIEETRGLYGSQEEALKQNLQVFSNFANKGVKPSNALLHQYNQNLFHMAKQAGMTADAMNTMINGIAEDTDSMTQLRAARQDERAAILANQQAVLSANIALGMIPKQAEEAAKMLNKMVAQKPLDRLKQAAKMRALGAAMGLGPEADRAAREMMKPKGQQDIAIISQFGTAVTNMADTAAQQGLSQEIFTSAILEKLDFEHYFGAGSPFSTTLGSANESLLDLTKNYKQSSDSTIVTLNYLASIATQAAKSLLDGTLIWSAMLDQSRYLTGLVDKLGNLFQMIGDGFNLAIAGFMDKLESLTGGFLFGGDSDMRLHKDKKEKESRQDAELARQKARQKESGEDEITKITREAREQKANIETQAAEKKRKDEELSAAREQYLKTGELPAAPTGQATLVQVRQDPVQQGAENVSRSRADAVQQEHTDLMSSQVNKIDMQLQSMSESNKYLKVIADTVPMLADLAAKQLAATTMSQEQRERYASRLRSDNAKFSAEYSYIA